MSKAEGAVAWAVAIANNPAHGYDQANRWGPDYDCASLVISAWESVGVSVREAGASYTGNMKGAFLACGFSDVTQQVNRDTGAGLQPGDVLLNYSAHAALVVKSGQIVAATLNEYGRTTGGQPGDQGREIALQAYYNYPWNAVLRLRESAEPTPVKQSAEKTVSGLPVLSRGSKGWPVVSLQGALIAHGYSCGPDGPDGDFGYNTWNALVRFQTNVKIPADGVAGEKTWTRLLLG